MKQTLTNMIKSGYSYEKSDFHEIGIFDEKINLLENFMITVEGIFM